MSHRPTTHTYTTVYTSKCYLYGDNWASDESLRSDCFVFPENRPNTPKAKPIEQTLAKMHIYTIFIARLNSLARVDQHMYYEILACETGYRCDLTGWLDTVKIIVKDRAAVELAS